MSIIDVLKKEAEKSGGKVRVVKVPPERRPTAESLAKLEAEISAQIRVCVAEAISKLVRNGNS